MPYLVTCDNCGWFTVVRFRNTQFKGSEHYIGVLDTIMLHSKKANHKRVRYTLLKEPLEGYEAHKALKNNSYMWRKYYEAIALTKRVSATNP